MYFYKAFGVACGATSAIIHYNTCVFLAFMRVRVFSRKKCKVKLQKSTKDNALQ